MTNNNSKTAAETMQDQIDELAELSVEETTVESNNNSVVESDNMTETVAELNNTPSFSTKSWQWAEAISNLDDPFKNESGHIVFFPKDVDPSKSSAKMLGKDIPLIARAAASAFSALRGDRYKLATTGFLLLNSEAESVDAVTAYSLPTCSGQVVIDGELVDVPVPTKDGISFLIEDPVFGFQEKYFVDRKWAFKVLCQKEWKLTPKQSYLVEAFWKVYATQIFISQPTVKIHVGRKTLNYVRKVLVNVDNPEAQAEAIAQSQFNEREYKRNKEQVENPTEDGSLRTKNGEKVSFDYKPRLVVVEQVGSRVSKVQIVAEDELNEAAFLGSSPKEIAVIERTEEGFGVVNFKVKVSQPAQLATMYNIAARDENDIAILS